MNSEFLIPGVKFSDALLWILAFFGLISLIITSAESSGLLPPGIVRWLARNRVKSYVEAFRRLGVRITTDEPVNQRKLLRRITDNVGITEPAYISALRSMLADDTFHSRVDIGNRTRFESDSFIDVIGSSTATERAEEYARILNSANLITNYDLVATPKLGSPILGYEFSRINKKPFILGCQEKVRDIDGTLGFHNILDYPKNLTIAGKRCLIVDDSTTGGRKVVDLVKKLREAGAEVKDVLVLFEPKGKGARANLREIDIELHSLVEGPSGNR